MSNNLYRVTPRRAKEYANDCLHAGLVPILESSPGIGKSSIMRQIAKDNNLKLIDHRLSTSAPEDLSGLPRFDEDGKAYFAPFTEVFPIEGMEVPKGYDGWLLFLDEFNAASKSVQAAAYKLILDKHVGQHRLHQRVVIGGAQNLSTDRSITNPLSTAMQSRVVHIEVQESFDDWLRDVAIPESYDNRIIAYLSENPSMLMDFRPDHNEKTFCCPRTWEFVNKLLKNEPSKTKIEEERTALYAGTITSGVAAQFVQFTNIFNSIVRLADILADPAECRLPPDNSSKWATITTMMEHITDKNFGHLCTYANRFTLNFRVLFFRTALIRKPELRAHPEFAKAMSELMRYLS